MGLFRRLFGAKKPGNSPPAKEKRRWSFVRSSNTTTTPSQPNNKRDTTSSPSLSPYEDSLDANKHAIAVAAATAAVAEAALAAAQAAAEVVRLTSSSGGSGGGVRCATSAQVSGWTLTQYRWAAVKIQSAFRGYLARRALRALKALVKLQALVRGHIVRKQTADMLRRMHTLVRLQAQARASRAHVSESFHSTKRPYNSRNAIFANLNKDEQQLRAYSTKFDGPSILKRCGSNSNLGDIINLDKARMGSNWLDCWMEETLWNNHRDTTARHRHSDDERNDKILEVDTWKPHLNSQQNNRTFRASQHVLASDYNSQSYMPIDSPSKLSTKVLKPIPCVSSGEVSSLSSPKFPIRKDEAALRTAENSPQMFSASSRPGSSSARRGPFTPARSECSWGYFSGYSGHPNYMANTESSRAKVRSQSAPRQRLEFERYGSARRSVQGFLDVSTNSEMGFAQHTEFRNKAFPASGRLNRLWSANLR